MERVVDGQHDYGSGLCKVLIEEHERIMKAIRERNGAAAKEEMYRHIIRSRDDMLTNYR